MSKENITYRIKETLSNKEIQQKSLCSAIGVAASTFNTWLKFNRSIPAEYLIPICEFLDIDIYWLLTGKTNVNITTKIITKEITLELTVDEDNLLDLYKNTTPKGQKMIQKTVREIWAENQRPKNKSLNSPDDEITAADQMA